MKNKSQKIIFDKRFTDNKNADNKDKLWEIYEYILNELKVGNDEPK